MCLSSDFWHYHFINQDDIDQFGDVGALDDNVESFLSNDAGDGGNLYGTIKQSPAEQQKEPPRSKLYVCVFILCLLSIMRMNDSPHFYFSFHLCWI